MGEVSEWRVEYLEELGVVVRTGCNWRREDREPLGLAYEVFEVVAFVDPPEFRRLGGSNEDTTDLDEAEKMFHGWIKWDGCSHNYFGDAGGYYHGCGRSDVTKIGKVLDLVWDRALEMLPDLKEFA